MERRPLSEKVSNACSAVNCETSSRMVSDHVTRTELLLTGLDLPSCKETKSSSDNASTSQIPWESGNQQRIARDLEQVTCRNCDEACTPSLNREYRIPK